MTNQPTDAFFAAWRTYRKIVDTNYMFHREIGERVEETLRAAFGGEGFSILDLGCGDASVFAPRLARLRPNRYVGVDLSETALGLAAENLKILACPAELRREDLLAAVGSGEERFDVIHTSFAVHHLSTEQKAEFFRRAAARLSERGLLLMTDVMREEDETLPLYHAHYVEWLRRDWSELTLEERETTCAHLVENDMPESFSILQAQARAAGLEAAPIAAFRWHKVARFTPRAG
ncbi:hypothetical protein MSC49_06370 [Methylosinus sp. C49]|uniref:class I SAM-dependent methyltransferase n=1 Tax=Methylosinus sp. C49 TaxID=2699395 RepID=UPI0013673FA2|nr:class I SAM-dependent methyltransferase [Methylosinus sp. C49]BBU60702.1 hypothetical protein MSC49_06370 [Methylosinus sp. C49]